MKILLVYPRYPDTFWSFKHALKFVSKKAAFPPLGLLTMAAMLPEGWEKKLVDMNTTNLNDRDIRWADYVFVSAMAVQRNSVKDVIQRCKNLGAKVVAGGPLFTTEHQEFEGVDHFVLNEAEVTLPRFLEDLGNGYAKHIYTSEQWPEIKATPIPAWELVDMKNYSSMSVQYSRGCPFDCEFCDIVLLNGRVPRTKDEEQLLRELDALYDRGWRSGVFIVDDNFIGNKRKLKEEILPAITRWMESKKRPFSFFTEASINLTDDEELIQLMVKAGFDMVFIGIETPNEDSLSECNKVQNKNRDLVASIKKLQSYGLQVDGGFIVGFDNDPHTIFEDQINLIQKSGIVTAMVGLLSAVPGTKLYHRLKDENRITKIFTGDNTDCSINFIPKMKHETLINGYRKVIKTIYAPRQYYDRVKTFLREYRPLPGKTFRLRISDLTAFIKVMWVLGIVEKGRRHYWRLLFWVLARRPKSFPTAVRLAVYGHHFRKVTESYS